ncbi:MAG TPA: zf-HC2 domain-containing protein, partial [Polyangiales bacterium]
MSMNREHPSPERLQGYFDDEVSPEERGELRAHVASCSDCRAQEAAWEKLHSFVATAIDKEARRLDSDRMFGAILSGIAADTGALPNVAANDTARKVVSMKRARRFSSAGPVAGA